MVQGLGFAGLRIQGVSRVYLGGLYSVGSRYRGCSVWDVACNWAL